MAISKRLRFEILKRDGFKCGYCHAHEVLLTIDHVVPKTLGGNDDPTNLIACCDDCNAGKTSTLPGGATVAAVDGDAHRWTRAMKRAAYVAREKHDEMGRYRETFKAQWDRWHYTADGKPIPLPENWGDFVDKFYGDGLPDWTWSNIVARAMEPGVGDRFKHACALARNKVYELQQGASVELVEGDGKVQWSDRGAAAIVTAAGYIWQTAWMRAREAELDPDVVAAFRERARSALSEEKLDAADLMKAARCAGEEDIDDLNEALEYAQQQEQEGDPDRWDRDKYHATWLEAWKEASPNGAEPGERAAEEFEKHVGAACGAGYEGWTIGYAAHQAGTDRSPWLADYLSSAYEVLANRKEWATHRKAVEGEATRRWLGAFVKAAAGDESHEPDTERFAVGVRWRITRANGAYILRAAEQAGSALDHEIDRYLPKDAGEEVPF